MSVCHNAELSTYSCCCCWHREMWLHLPMQRILMSPHRELQQRFIEGERAQVAVHPVLCCIVLYRYFKWPNWKLRGSLKSELTNGWSPRNEKNKRKRFSYRLKALTVWHPAADCSKFGHRQPWDGVFDHTSSRHARDATDSDFVCCVCPCAGNQKDNTTRGRVPVGLSMYI